MGLGRCCGVSPLVDDAELPCAGPPRPVLQSCGHRCQGGALYVAGLTAATIGALGPVARTVPKGGTLAVGEFAQGSLPVGQQTFAYNAFGFSDELIHLGAMWVK